MLACKRLKIIFSELSCCEKFADVGCDHGYIAEEMLLSGKAKYIVASDISAPSLDKARDRLKGYIPEKAECTVSDGLKNIPVDCDLVLIAGMGGEEIIKIIKEAPFLPQKLVLQPMKNADKVRKAALSMGYAIKKDYLFRDKKFYDLISLEKGTDNLTEDEMLFGRDNLKTNGKDFKSYLEREIKKYEGVLSGELSEETKKQVKAKIEKLKEIYAK